jgi:hypothetical protein
VKTRTPLWKRLVLGLMYAEMPNAWIAYLVLVLAGAWFVPWPPVRAALGAVAMLIGWYYLQIAMSRLQHELELVIAPDELDRCCVVVGGQRCERPPAYRVANEDGGWDDYTYTCEEHMRRVLKPGYVATYLNR